MSDIVERLKKHASLLVAKDNALLIEAASEIERLRAGYERLERILIKQSLAADERASDALAFVRYINAARAALEEK